jgi:hypothetical protein
MLLPVIPNSACARISLSLFFPFQWGVTNNFKLGRIYNSICFKFAAGAYILSK